MVLLKTAVDYNTPVMTDLDLETGRASSILSYAILLGGILTIGVALYVVVVSYSSFPFSDQWYEVRYAAGGGNLLSPAWLWERDNEHRIVIPKLFLAADISLFYGRQVFLLASIFAIQMLHLALLSWSMRALGGWRGALWRTGTGLAAFCLFCPTQWENFVWGLQVSNVLPPFLATVSFVTLLLYWTNSQQHPEKRWLKFLVISILAAVGATYSLATGTLVWPILILAALYLRLCRAALLSYVIGSVVCGLLYFYRLNLSSRWHKSGHAIASAQVDISSRSRLVSPLKVLEYLANYFIGSLIHQGTHVTQFILLGVLAMVVVGLLAAIPYIRKLSVFGNQLVLIMMFCTATAMLTAAGRAQLGTEQAMVSRYQTISLLFWCCGGLLLLGATFFAHGPVRYGFLVAQVCLLVIFVAGAASASHPIGEARQHGFELDGAGASLLAGVHDPRQLAWAPPELDTVPGARYLKANQLSVFADPVSSVLGKPLEGVFTITPSADCTGALESVVPIVDTSEPGVRLTGWAWDVKHQRLPSAIVVTTNGTITGVGSVGGWRPDVAGIQPAAARSHPGYIAFLSEPAGTSVVKVYAILRGSPPAACQFAIK